MSIEHLLIGYSLGDLHNIFLQLRSKRLLTLHYVLLGCFFFVIAKWHLHHMFCLQVQPGVNIESALCNRPASSVPADAILPPPSTDVKPPTTQTTQHLFHYVS